MQGGVQYCICDGSSVLIEASRRDKLKSRLNVKKAESAALCGSISAVNESDVV